VRHLCILLIRFYKIALSPLANAFTGGQGCCRYWPGCSSYGLEAFRRFGTIKGGWLTFLRLLRCAPWGGTGWDPVPETFRWMWWPKCDGEPVPETCEDGHTHASEPAYPPRTRPRRF
jgi:putative membrane protein insertion efficiency factor